MRILITHINYKNKKMGKLNLSAEVMGELAAESMSLFEERFMRALNSDVKHVYIVAAYREITRDMREAMARQDGELNYTVVYMPQDGITESVKDKLINAFSGKMGRHISFVY